MAENAADAAAPDRLKAWVLGIVVALVIAYCGISRVCEELATMAELHNQHRAYQGSNALAIGVVWIALAGFLHFHYFWSWRERFYAVGQVGKAISMIVVAGGILYFVFHALVVE